MIGGAGVKMLYYYIHCILTVSRVTNFKHFSFKKIVLLTMLLIPLGWSTISLAHAMEQDQEVHQQHQCEFYDVISQGLATTLHLPALPNNAICVQPFSAHLSALLFSALPRSRSPPVALSVTF